VSTDIALLFLEPRHYMGVGSQPHAPAAYTPGKEPVPIVEEAGWAPGPVRTGAENLVPTGIRYTDRPTRSSVVIPTELPGPQTPFVILQESLKIGDKIGTHKILQLESI
jgi:hypothetical protein